MHPNEETTLTARPARMLLLLATVVLTGVNLRSFLTAAGPLAVDIQRSTGLSQQGMAWLTFLPVALMGAGAFASPWVARKLGSRRSILIALAMLGLGSLLRLEAHSGLALIGTAALCGLGVAIVQAIFPAVIKAQMPLWLAPVMGLYSAAMMGGGALGAQLSPLMAQTLGDWRIALAILGLPCLLALGLAWIALPKSDACPKTRPVPLAPLLRCPRAWLLMLCFGLVNGGYSTLVAWLAPFYQTHGWSATGSGSLVAVMTLSQAAAALLLPILARRNLDRRAWLWLSLALQAVAFTGLASMPDLYPKLWAAVGGAGLGGFFALFMVVALDHDHRPAHAAALSAVMQGGGFFIAALSPWLAAILHDHTDGFTAGWLVHLGCIGIVAALTAILSPSGYAASLRHSQASALPPAGGAVTAPLQSRQA